MPLQPISIGLVNYWLLGPLIHVHFHVFEDIEWKK